MNKFVIQNVASCINQLPRKSKGIFQVSWSRQLSMRCVPVSHICRAQNSITVLQPTWFQRESISSQALQMRQMSTDGMVDESKPSSITRLKEYFGLQGDLKHPQGILAEAGVVMYLCCSEAVDYNKLFDNFDMPDSFHSWFILHELHVWLCMVRLADEGRSGKMVRDWVVQSMWKDVKAKSRKIGQMTESKVSNEVLSALNDGFRTNLVNYDEGLLGDDQVLAASVWRAFFMKRDVPFEQVELMVHYIRKQVHHLEKQSSKDMLAKGIVTFLPLHNDKLAKDTLEYLTKMKKEANLLV